MVWYTKYVPFGICTILERRWFFIPNSENLSEEIWHSSQIASFCNFKIVKAEM